MSRSLLSGRSQKRLVELHRAANSAIQNLNQHHSLLLGALLGCDDATQRHMLDQHRALVANAVETLQAENTKLKEELERVKKDQAGAAAEKSALVQRNRALEATASRGNEAQQQATDQLERTRGQLQELVTKFRETAQTLRDVETDRAGVRSQLALKEREFNVCVDRSAALYNLNTEVLDKMENRGFWASVTEREPFTRLKRVELENLIDDYRYRAEELRAQERERAQAATP